MSARRAGRPSVFAIVGKASAFDSFLAEEALERILADAIGDNRQEALEVLRGEEVTWARVADAARSPSLFVALKAVVVRAADAVKGGEEEIVRFLDAPVAGTVLILMAAKPDRRRKAWQRILAGAEVVPAEALKGRALMAYARDQARRRQVALPPDALDELVEHVGQDLRRLTGELDKLAAFSRDGHRELTPDDVAAVVGRGLGRPLYRLSDAISGREVARALELIDEMLEEGERGPYLVGVLYRAVRQIRGIRALQSQHLRQDEIASRLRILPFKIADLTAAAARWTDAGVRRALGALGRADRLLKRGADPATTLDAAVVSICGRSAPKTLSPSA